MAEQGVELRLQYDHMQHVRTHLCYKTVNGTTCMLATGKAVKCDIIQEVSLTPFKDSSTNYEVASDSTCCTK